MKGYLKLTVTKHDLQIIVFATTFGNSRVISILAQRNKSVMVDEAFCHEDAYSKLNWITIS